MEILELDEFIELGLPIVDVRAPKEYLAGHIPRAVNIPIFDDEERAKVGTIYKQKGKEEAIKLGEELAEAKKSDFLKRYEELASNKTVAIHCWRGGLRSAKTAEFLESKGFTTFLLKGGYKRFRQRNLNLFKQDFKLRVLGGYTGSGKTEVLRELKKLGTQVIDLEGLAHHRGSAFGHIGLAPQPTTETFENQLAEELLALDHQQEIWVEDESRNIGAVYIPEDFWNQIRIKPLLVIEIDQERRLDHLCEVYGNQDIEQLKLAFERIKRRLGGQNLQVALENLENGDIRGAARISLNYYDKAYRWQLENKTNASISTRMFDHIRFDEIAKSLLSIPA